MLKRLIALSLVVSACGGGSSNPVDAPTVSQIGPAGGMVVSGAATLMVPAGALATMVTITVEETTPPAAGAYAPNTKFYKFGPEGQTFTSNFTVIMTYPGTPPTGSTVIFTTPGSTTQYQSIGGTVSGNTISGQTNHFSSGGGAIPQG